jgi:hypothetical protein
VPRCSPYSGDSRDGSSWVGASSDQGFCTNTH